MTFKNGNVYKNISTISPFFPLLLSTNLFKQIDFLMGYFEHEIKKILVIATRLSNLPLLVTIFSVIGNTLRVTIDRLVISNFFNSGTTSYVFSMTK